MNTLIEANMSCLRQGIELLNELPCELYRSKCSNVFGSSIGGHFRHNIDHYLAFSEGFASKRVDYDARLRNVSIEEEPIVAQAALQQMVSFFGEISAEDLDMLMEVRMDDGGDSTWSRSSLRRELQFLLSHTIHHYALVVAIATHSGHTDFPDGFGVAPSTLHYREKLGI